MLVVNTTIVQLTVPMKRALTLYQPEVVIVFGGLATESGDFGVQFCEFCCSEAILLLCNKASGSSSLYGRVL